MTFQKCDDALFLFGLLGNSYSIEKTKFGGEIVISKGFVQVINDRVITHILQQAEIPLNQIDGYIVHALWLAAKSVVEQQLPARIAAKKQLAASPGTNS